jgi:alpha-galactosidase
VKKDGDVEIWAKPLRGGATAIGVFNRGAAEASMTLRCSDLQLCGSKIRDLWAQVDRGTFAETYGVSVPSHGVALLRMAK